MLSTAGQEPGLVGKLVVVYLCTGTRRLTGSKVHSLYPTGRISRVSCGIRNLEPHNSATELGICCANNSEGQFLDPGLVAFAPWRVGDEVSSALVRPYMTCACSGTYV